MSVNPTTWFLVKIVLTILSLLHFFLRNIRVSLSIPANVISGFFLLFSFYQWFLSNHIFWCTCLYVPCLAVNWASWVNGASLVAQMVKNLPTMQETQVWSLGQDDDLENGRASHSTILAWRIPWTEEPGGLYSPWVRKRVGHNLATNTFNISNIYILIFFIKFEICEALFLEIFFLSPAFGGLYINRATWSCTCSVSQSCLTLCSPMDCSTPGFPVHHQLLELAQTHVLWVSDAIQPSQPLSPPSPPAISLFQHQGLFQWVGPLHQVAKVLELQLQHQFFQWIFRVDFF